MIARLAVVFLFGFAAAAQAATILDREPAMGALQEGQVVYVNNPSCPKGQVMKVTGGNHTKVGGKKQIERSRMCVPRPN